MTSNWNSNIRREDDMYIESAAYTTALAYTFSDSHYFTAVSHTPTFNNLKNDFVVWGNRKGVNGVDIPIHMRIALDKKPEFYTTISIDEDESERLIDEYGFEYEPSDVALSNPEVMKKEKRSKYYQKSYSYSSNQYDWRELIYRMALDYFKYGSYDYFLTKIAEANYYNKDQDNK
jgi:hypothetical protein